MKFTKQQKIDYLKKKLSTDIKWAIRGMLRIYEAQTDEEKNSSNTIDFNGVGFSGVDAKFLTGVCEFYNRCGFVTEKQIPYVLVKMKKYATQILNISDEEKLEKNMMKEIDNEN